MKLIIIGLLIALASCDFHFHFPKKLKPAVIDASFLKDLKKPETISFTEINNQALQLGDTSKVEAFLDNLLDGIAEKRAQKLQIITNVRAQCAEERSFRAQEIQDGQDAADASQKQYNLCSDQAQRAAYLNSIAQNAFTAHTNELAELDAARDIQHRVYLQRVDYLNALKAALVEVSQLLDTFESAYENVANSPKFLQSTNKLFQQTVKTGQYALVMPIYTKLIQMHSKQFDSNDVIEVRSLLETVADNVADSLESVEDQEATDEQNYNDARTQLVAILDRLNTQITFTDRFGVKMQACLAQEASITELAEDKVARNSALLEQAEELCSLTETEWQVSETSRLRTVSVINALKTAVVRIEQDYEVEIISKTADSDTSQEASDS